MVELISGEKQLMVLKDVRYMSRCLLKFSFRRAIELIITNKRIIENNPKMTSQWGYRSWWYNDADYEKSHKGGDSQILNFSTAEEKLKIKLTSVIFNAVYSIRTDRAQEISQIIQKNTSQ